MAWIYTINTIFDGEFVKSRVINRPLNQLVQRTQYLYDIIQELSAGQLLVAPNVTIAPGMLCGQPVYYDDDNSRFDKALSEVETGQNNYGVPTVKAFCRGILLTKHTENSGDIALYGRVKQSVYEDIDWSLISDGGSQFHGDVNVSAVEAGNLSQADSHLVVRVGSLDGDGNLLLQPSVSGGLRDHVHYKFQLTESLGTAITDEGWLPEAVFTANGIQVPSGYTYGYNVETDTSLSGHFPPTPVVANNLYVDGALAEESEDYTVDTNGIWWKGTDTPWTKPTFFFTAELDVPTGIVTSLAPSGDGIPVQAVNSSGDPATTGDLYLKLLAADLFAADTIAASYGISTTVRSDGKLSRTSLASRLIPGSGISMSGDIGNDTDGYAGKVTVNAGVTSSVQVSAVVAELTGTAEDKYEDLPVVSFPSGRTNTDVRYKIAIPTNVQASRKLTLNINLLAAVAVSDSLDADYFVVRPGVAVPTTWTSLSSIAAGITSPGKPNSVTSDEISCEPGDTVVVRLTQPTTPAYDLMIVSIIGSIGS